MRLSPSAARTAATILFGNSMCRLVANDLEVSPSKSFDLLGPFTGVKKYFKKVVHRGWLVKLGFDYRLGPG
jgi:hypothetical protein